MNLKNFARWLAASFSASALSQVVARGTGERIRQQSRGRVPRPARAYIRGRRLALGCGSSLASQHTGTESREDRQFSGALGLVVAPKDLS